MIYYSHEALLCQAVYELVECSCRRFAADGCDLFGQHFAHHVLPDKNWKVLAWAGYNLREPVVLVPGAAHRVQVGQNFRKWPATRFLDLQPAFNKAHRVFPAKG